MLGSGGEEMAVEARAAAEMAVTEEAAAEVETAGRQRGRSNGTAVTASSRE